MFLMIMFAVAAGMVIATMVSTIISTIIAQSTWYAKIMKKMSNKYLDTFLKEES